VVDDLELVAPEEAQRMCGCSEWVISEWVICCMSASWLVAIIARQRKV
jgi:hypothetical protein